MYFNNIKVTIKVSNTVITSYWLNAWNQSVLTIFQRRKGGEGCNEKLRLENVEFLRYTVSCNYLLLKFKHINIINIIICFQYLCMKTCPPLEGCKGFPCQKKNFTAEYRRAVSWLGAAISFIQYSTNKETLLTLEQRIKKDKRRIMFMR